MLKVVKIVVISILALYVSSAYAIGRGGSNYGWYDLNGCDREPYGVLKNYHTKKAIIDQQLADMRAAGQARLRIPIYHMRGGHWNGTILNSSGGDLSSQMRTNLTNLLAAIKQAGFSEIEVGFFPQGDNYPPGWNRNSSWTSWHESYFQENWNLIYRLQPIIANAGILYRIDLMNEGSAPSSYLGPNIPYHPTWSEYARKLWINYNLRFSKSTTLGFSIPVKTHDIAARVNHLNYIYSSNLPYLYDLHLYDNVLQGFLAADSEFDAIGLANPGWIIGETWYNDATAANDIKIGMNPWLGNRTVHYVTQWPLERNASCSNVSVAPPLQFQNYILEGF